MTTETIRPTTVPTAATGSLATQVREYKKANPKALPKEISKALGIPAARIYAINNYEKKRVQRLKAKKKAVRASLVNLVPPVMRPQSQGLPYGKNTDPVNHPAHYKVGGIETIDFIEAKQLNYNLGNVVKYITRADHKGNAKEDLLKARWYLNREIAKVNKGAK